MDSSEGLLQCGGGGKAVTNCSLLVCRVVFILLTLVLWVVVFRCSEGLFWKSNWVLSFGSGLAKSFKCFQLVGGKTN